uniref:hypothetical protein n=1 Tax=Pseudoalteromonas sp. TaxID=53249 RepID=UPI003D27B5D1
EYGYDLGFSGQTELAGRADATCFERYGMRRKRMVYALIISEGGILGQGVALVSLRDCFHVYHLISAANSDVSNLNFKL